MNKIQIGIKKLFQETILNSLKGTKTKLGAV